MAKSKPQGPGESKSAGAGQRRALEQVAMSLSTLLLLAIVVMINFLAFRNYERMDWTSEGMFTLSDKSRTVVRELEQDVDIYLFLSQGEPSFDHVDELLRRYRAVSGRLQVHYVDPDREPAEFKVLAQRYGVIEAVTGTGEVMADVAAVVARGDQNWHINRHDLIGFEFGAEQQVHELAVKAEQALTGAIVQVVSGRATKVCVTQGHGEWSLDEGAPERSLASLKLGLRHDNIEWEAIETLGKDALPDACDAVFVIGPQRAFSDSEAKLVLDYVQAGGNALLALDPVIERDRIKPTGFEQPLRALGVQLDNSLAVELSPERLLSANTVEFIVTEFGDHETTRALQNRARIVVALARTLSVTQPNERIEPLLRASDESFGATDLGRIMQPDTEPARGPGDLEGPVDLALALRTNAESESPEAPGGRLIVVGDSDLFQPGLLEAPELANFHLASAFTGWLAEREALIEIPPKKVKGGTAMFTQDELTALLFRVAVLLPGAALLLGVAVWFNRRA